MLDLQAFVAGLKSHALEHGLHVDDDRHYVETYSGEQVWHIGLHSADDCASPIAVELSLTATRRVLMAFEDALFEPETDGSNNAPTDETATHIAVPLSIEVSVTSLTAAPDLLLLATEIAAQSKVPMSPTLGSTVEPLDEGEEYSLRITGEVWLSLMEICRMEDLSDVCAALDSARAVCDYLSDHVAL